MVLDSLGGRQDTAVTNILKYLNIEWETNGVIDKSKAVFSFDSSEMRILIPRCPGQTDVTSCGLYLIHYIQNIFKNVDRYCTSDGYQHLESWRQEEKIHTMRSDIATLLRQISNDQSPSDQDSNDLDYLKSYAKLKVANQKDLSLYRKYRLNIWTTKLAYTCILTLTPSTKNLWN